MDISIRNGLKKLDSWVAYGGVGPDNRIEELPKRAAYILDWEPDTSMELIAIRTPEARMLFVQKSGAVYPLANEIALMGRGADTTVYSDPEYAATLQPDRSFSISDKLIEVLEWEEYDRLDVQIYSRLIGSPFMVLSKTRIDILCQTHKMYCAEIEKQEDSLMIVALQEKKEKIRLAIEKVGGDMRGSREGNI